jgi:SAM-dependent methyltransferase
VTRRDDAFGQQLWDIYHTGYQHQIIERSDGLIEVGRGAIYFSEYPEWSAEEHQALALARGRVLDVGCGAGRHALHLQQRGLDVLGIDVSPRAIELCRVRGLRRAQVLPVGDVHRLGDGAFDTVLMLGNNLGLLGGRSRGRRTLRKLGRLTSDSGRIIAQALDPYQTDDPLHLAYHRQNRERGRMGGQIRMRSRHRNLIGPWFDYLFVSREELAALVEGTGWTIGRVIGEGAHYIAVLEKGGEIPREQSQGLGQYQSA